MRSSATSTDCSAGDATSGGSAGSHSNHISSPEILESAEFSPSVGNSQPWRWVEVQTASAREAVRDSFVRCNTEALGRVHRRARAAVFVTETRRPRRRSGPPGRVLRARRRPGPRTRPPDRAGNPRVLRRHRDHHHVAGGRGRGVGIGWVSILEPGEVTAALAVPSAWKLVAYLCVGYPEHENDIPRTRARRLAVPHRVGE